MARMSLGGGSKTNDMSCLPRPGLSGTTFAMKSTETAFSIPAPFSLKATALGHGWHECAPFSWCEGGACLQVIERRGDMPVRLSMVQTDDRDGAARVRLVIEADEVDKGLKGLMIARAKLMLRADLDLSGFYKMATRHKPIRAAARIGSGRILRNASMIENIIKTICATNVVWGQAVKMINRIAQLGPGLREFRSLNAWPSPREILNAGEDYLLGVARVGYRSVSILELCAAACDGRFDDGALDTLAETADTKVLQDRLLAIRGVGPASARFLLSLLGHYDRLSIDSWTRQFVSDRYFEGGDVTPKQIEEIYEPFGQWRQLVWWTEQWLEWETARSIVKESRKVPRRTLD